ncbi:MAG: hypothetical protein AVO39_02355 [delta proteobacterium MLS_D]|nr:MAG: hypothetical protein AVO39_02355 [delta proteobacterium MLS_D]
MNSHTFCATHSSRKAEIIIIYFYRKRDKNVHRFITGDAIQSRQEHFLFLNARLSRVSQSPRNFQAGISSSKVGAPAGCPEDCQNALHACKNLS